MAKEYIERESLLEDIEKSVVISARSEDKANAEMRGVRKILDRIKSAPTADVVEVVRHGKWHIMPEDPEDESECPTEAGWYRIITTYGEEMTDYYFNKPTMCGRGVVYWKNCKKVIRAWAKMDGKDGEGK